MVQVHHKDSNNKYRTIHIVQIQHWAPLVVIHSQKDLRMARCIVVMQITMDNTSLMVRISKSIPPVVVVINQIKFNNHMIQGSMHRSKSKILVYRLRNKVVLGRGKIKDQVFTDKQKILLI